jgi:hypothetical protein
MADQHIMFFSMCFPFRKTVLQGQIQKLKSFLDVAHLHLAGNSRKTSITGRLVPGHPYGHPKQWDAVKDLPKWDRCWDRCWGGLELKYTWNILKRGFYFGSWWFWCSSKGAVSWYVRNQWTPRMAGNFWMIVLDPTTPTTPVSITSPMCIPSFQSWTSLKIPTLIKHGWKTSRWVRWFSLHFSIYRGSCGRVPVANPPELCRTHLAGATGLKTCLLLRSAAVTSPCFFRFFGSRNRKSSGFWTVEGCFHTL